VRTQSRDCDPRHGKGLKGRRGKKKEKEKREILTVRNFSFFLRFY
jgi:hypothetical protein